MDIKAQNLSDLKVALVHESLTVPAGAEKVLAELHRLFPHAPIYTPLYKPEKFPEFKDADVRTGSLNRWSFWRNHHQMAIPLLPFAMEQFDLSEYDLVISDSTNAAKGVLTRPETLHICYCHSPMRWAWMPYLDRRASQSWLRRWAAHYLRIWDVASLPRVDYWLCNSHTTASRIKKFYGKHAKTIYPPIETAEHPQPSHDNDGYYLTVGRLIPGNYKRTDLIIDGVKKAEVPLKIAGDGPLLDQFKKQAGSGHHIQLLGRVSDDERNHLYARCKAFIFAAEEDFGIVPLEAMSYGKPVIAFGRGGASEYVIDKKTGILFPEQTADSLALAIREFEQVSFDPEAIAKHAEHFSPARFRREMLDFITEILKKHGKA